MADRNHENLESLVSGCIQKDQRAQEKLYKMYFGYALSVALLYCNDRNCAMAVVNDSFIKIFSQIKRFDLQMSFKVWLRKIVINTALDQLRKEKRSPRFDQAEILATEDLSAGITAKLQARDIEALLDYLPHILKTVFCLYEIEGYSHGEISKLMNIPESSSRVYLTRARKNLRELYLLNNK